MAKETRQPFTSTGDYHARRGFRFHGRNYAPGDEFPWKQLSCSPRKLRQLYEGRFIEPGLAPPEEVETPAPEVPEVPVTEEVTTEETEEKEEKSEADPGETEEVEKKEEEPEKEPQKFVFNPKHHQVKSAGSGKWKVTTNSGKFRLSITRKEAQRLKKVRKKTEVRPEEIVE